MDIIASEEKIEALKETLVCPITQEIFLDPYITPCGHTFEHAEIKKALAVKSQCPQCRAKINMVDLKRNYALHSTINAILELFPAFASDQFLSIDYVKALIVEDKIKILENVLRKQVSWATKLIEANKSVLHLAIEHQKIEILTYLLQNFNYDLNQLELHPLLFATEATRINAKIIDLLLSHGADPSVVSSTGETVLMQALSIRRGYPSMQLLLRSGKALNVNQQSSMTGECALTLAAKYAQDADFVMLLTTPGINVNARNNKGKTALFVAASLGQVEKVKALLACPDIDVESECLSGRSAYTEAGRHGHVGVIELLTALPAQKALLKNKLRYHQIQKAAAVLEEIYRNHNETDFRQALQEVEQNFPDQWPMFAAAFYENSLPHIIGKNDEMVLFSLLKAAPECLNKIVSGGSALHWLLREKQFTLLKKTIEVFHDGIDLNVLSRFKTREKMLTPLILAITSQDELAVAYLLEKTVTIDNPFDLYATSTAIQSKHKNIIRLVLDAVKARYLRNPQPHDAISMRKALLQSVTYSDLEVFQWVLAMPTVDVNSKFYFDRTCLHFAVRSNDLEKVKMILQCPRLDFYAKTVDDQTVMTMTETYHKHSDRHHQPMVELLQFYHLSHHLLQKKPPQKMHLDFLANVDAKQLAFMLETLKIQHGERPEIDSLIFFISQLRHIKLDPKWFGPQFQAEPNIFIHGIEVLNRFFLNAHTSYYKNHGNWETLIRREAFQQLKNVIQNLNADEQIHVLTWARTQPVFAYHRHFLSFGRTQTVIDIDKMITSLQKSVSQKSVMPINQTH